MADDSIEFISDYEEDHFRQGPLTAWICPLCTIKNQPTYLVCDCCGQERPSAQITGVEATHVTNPSQLPVSLLESQPTQPNPAPPPLDNSSTEIWTCSACTFINSTLCLDCDVCGAPADTATAPRVAEPVGNFNRHQQQQQQQQHNTNQAPSPAPKLHIPLNDEFTYPSVNEEESSQKVYDLDCGCKGPFIEIKEAVKGAVVTLPSAPSLLCLLRHFPCPAHTTTSNTASTSRGRNSTNTCTKQMSRRDVEALLGRKAAAALDRGFYSAAVSASANTANGNNTSLDTDLDNREDGEAGPSTSAAGGGGISKPYLQLSRQCQHLAATIADLHAAMTSSEGDQTTASAFTVDPYADVGTNVNDPQNGSGLSERQQREKERREERERQRQKKRGPATAGVGYGGHESRDDVHRHRHLKEQAAARQRTADTRTALLLRTIRDAVRQLLQEEEHLLFLEISPLGWLPLAAVGILQGSPLAACLRLLLCNDSLMDITERREVYSEALHLLSLLASRQELIPLLLVPADGDILAQFSSSSGGSGDKSHGKKEEEDVRHPKRARTSGASSAAAAAAAVVDKNKNKNKVEEAADVSFEAGLGRSCWKALQSFTLQCKLFIQNAQQLAGDGSEEDVSDVGTVLLVQETCTAVDKAVNAWKMAHTAQNTTVTSTRNNSVHADGAGPSGINNNAARTRNPTTTTTATPTLIATMDQLKQQYKQSMSEISFRSINLIDGGDYYFRNLLSSKAQGDASARLRRLMKEISTLSGQLPTDWESTILVVNDENRMDAFRAVIFPPTESPYSNGAFFFDIFLPPDYPSSPPKVQFLTTGAGKIRFNPNLYDSGKVCLSLLGTWEGPGWQPESSTLLQVLISIQAMILGETNPYGNEPGFEKYLHTPDGKRSSDSYNRMQRYNTIQYSILPAVQAVVHGGDASASVAVPKGFEEALKVHFTLKSGEIERQLMQWKKENAAFNYEIGAAGGGGGGGGSSKNKNKNSMSMARRYGSDAIPDKNMDTAIDSVINLLDKLS